MWALTIVALGLNWSPEKRHFFGRKMKSTLREGKMAIEAKNNKKESSID